MVNAKYPNGEEIKSIYARHLEDFAVGDPVLFTYVDSPDREKRKRRQPSLIQADKVIAADWPEVENKIEEITTLLKKFSQKTLQEKADRAIREVVERVIRQEQARLNEERIVHSEEYQRRISELEAREKKLFDATERLAEKEASISRLIEIKLADRRMELDKKEEELLKREKGLADIVKQIDKQKKQISDENERLKKAKREFEKQGGAAYLEYVNSINVPGDKKQIPTTLSTEWKPLNVETFKDELAGVGFQLDETILLKSVLATLTAWSSGQFVIMSGPTGVGKTQLVSRLAEAVGAGSGVVSVRPSWVEPADLLGFYNAMHKIYEPTPFIDHLIFAQEYENVNRFYFICLDEMNLSRVENYAADILSKLELVSKNQSAFLDLYSAEIGRRLRDEERLALENMANLGPEDRARVHSLTRQLHRYQPKLKLPGNLALFGTVNVDETTQMFSPKFLDRSFVVRFPPVNLADSLSISSCGTEQLPLLWPWPFDKIEEKIRKTDQNRFRKNEEIWKDFLDWQSNFLPQLGVHLGYRFAASFRRFMQVSSAIGLENPYRAADYFFEAKILPRIQFGVEETAPGQSDSKKFDILEKWHKELRGKRKYPELVKMIDDMVNRSNTTHMVEFWD